jgi:hypothetical protein
MRTATFCTLCAALATVSLSCNQANAAALTVHTDVPAVKVHVPPPKVNVHSFSPKVHNVTVRGAHTQSLETSDTPRDPSTGMATGKRMHKPLHIYSAYDKKTEKPKASAGERPNESLSINYGKIEY